MQKDELWVPTESRTGVIVVISPVPLGGRGGEEGRGVHRER